MRPCDVTRELMNPETYRAWLRDFYWDFYFLEPHTELSGVCPISEVVLLPKARVTGPLYPTLKWTQSLESEPISTWKELLWTYGGPAS